MATVVLPGLTNTERPATLTNVEGRAQRSALAVMGPVQAKEDWRIFRALSDRFAKPLPYNTREALQAQLAAVDHRYALDNLEAGELSAACDHKPVSTGLPLQAGNGSRSGLLLVVEPVHFQDDAVARQSTILSQLTLGRTAPLGALRINPQDAGSAGIQDGQKVRVLCGDSHVECVASLDENVPAQVVFGDMGQSSALLQDLCNWESGFPQVSLVGL
jgi:NADH-quinone oxidoreductase subunit G